METSAGKVGPAERINDHIGPTATHEQRPTEQCKTKVQGQPQRKQRSKSQADHRRTSDVQQAVLRERTISKSKNKKNINKMTSVEFFVYIDFTL